MVVNSKGIPRKFQGNRSVGEIDSIPVGQNIYIYHHTNICLTIGLVYIYIYICVCYCLGIFVEEFLEMSTTEPGIQRSIGLLRGAGSKGMGFPKVPLEDGG